MLIEIPDSKNLTKPNLSRRLRNRTNEQEIEAIPKATPVSYL
jgi:hypothetical protein